MKVRQGFVSNSSSTSFSIYGLHLSTQELEEIYKSLQVEDNKIIDTFKEIEALCLARGISKELVKNIKNSMLNEQSKLNTKNSKAIIYEKIDEIESIPNFSIYRNDYNVYMGRESSSIGEDETGSQFKESVHSAIENLFGKDTKILGKELVKKCQYYEEEISNE